MEKIRIKEEKDEIIVDVRHVAVDTATLRDEAGVSRERPSSVPSSPRPGFLGRVKRCPRCRLRPPSSPATLRRLKRHRHSQLFAALRLRDRRAERRSLAHLADRRAERRSLAHLAEMELLKEQIRQNAQSQRAVIRSQNQVLRTGFQVLGQILEASCKNPQPSQVCDQEPQTLHSI